MKAEKLTQYGLFLGISFVAMVFLGALDLLDNHYFQPYFGETKPLILVGISIILGLLLLQVHLSNRWLLVYRKESHKGFLLSSGLACLFGLIIIIVDLLEAFPPDINVSFPESLLFYPAIGFIVEIFFHLLPLTLLIALFTSMAKKWSFNKVVWISIILVALIEPIYQGSSVFGEQETTGTNIYVGIHIFLINLCQLWLFKRYDFISMYLFRLIYYLIWHVTWGYLRLQLLF